MASKALLVDYQWCSGCHACEIACRMEHDLPNDQFGIKVNEMVWPIEGDTWEYTYLATPTDQCDACVARTSKGKLPTCVHHCQAQCLTYGDVSELAQECEQGARKALFMI